MLPTPYFREQENFNFSEFSKEYLAHANYLAKASSSYGFQDLDTFLTLVLGA